MKMTKMVRQVMTGAAAIAAMATLPGSAFAGPITGFLGIAGGITYDTVGNTGSAILDWRPSGGGTGIAFVVTEATDYFNPDGDGDQGIDVGTMLSIRDLTNDPALAGPIPAPAYAPAGAADVQDFLSNFVDLSDGTIDPLTSDFRFDLTEMVLQSGAACTGSEGAGDSCVLGDIFLLTETTEGLRIHLDVRGFFRHLDDEGFYKGAFSTTFTDLSFADAFERIGVNPGPMTGQNLDCPTGNNGGRTACTFDANFTPAQPIPEPASLLLFGTGSTLLALRRRRNKK
jgi:hypothetical protein